MFPGFGDRLLNEVRKHPLSPKDTKIRIAAPPERLYSTWIGGMSPDTSFLYCVAVSHAKIRVVVFC